MPERRNADNGDVTRPGECPDFPPLKRAGFDGSFKISLSKRGPTGPLCVLITPDPGQIAATSVFGNKQEHR